MMTAPEFSAITFDSPPAWAKQTRSPVAFAELRGAENPPSVMFCQLALRPASLDYLAELEQKHDVRARWRERSPGYSFAEQHFQIFGWTQKPETSSFARNAFGRAIKGYLPERSGRSELIDDLGEAAAGVAAAFDRIRLRFILRAERGVGKFQLHEDDGTDYSAGAYLIGGGTVMAAPGSWAPSARRRIKLGYDPNPAIHYQADERMLREARQLPAQCIAAWPERQPHAAPGDAGPFRLALFAYADSVALRPAPPVLRWHHRLQHFLVG
jgi:hypothetical protein